MSTQATLHRNGRQTVPQAFRIFTTLRRQVVTADGGGSERFTRGVVPAVQTPLAAGTNRQQPHSASLLQPPRVHREPATPKPGSLAQRGAALIDNAHAEKVEPGRFLPNPAVCLQRVYNMSETVEERSKKQTPEPRMEEKPAPLRQAKTKPSGEPKVNLGSFWGRALTRSARDRRSPVPGHSPTNWEDILSS